MKKCVLSVLVLLLMLSTYTAFSDRAQINLPHAWPKQVCVGFANYDTIAALKDYKKSAGIEILSTYLNGGFTSGWAMQYGFWSGAPGAHLTGKITEYAKQDVIPAFTYYQFQDVAVVGGTERQKVLATVNNASTMSKYWQDLKYFFTYAGQFPEQMVVLHIEPDFWGFCQQEGFDKGVDWTKLPAKVAGSGDPDMAGLPDTIDGYASGIKRLRDNLAPNVALAYHMSFWTSGLHKRYYEYDDATLKAAGQQSASLVNMLTAKFDLIFTEVSDGDIVWNKSNNSVDSSLLWKDEEFANYKKYIRAFSDNVHLPIVLWQIAPGNTLMRSMNNSYRHYQSNFAQHYLSWTWEKDLNSMLDSGIVGYIFESHATNERFTRIYDWANDGVTNPTPINGNNTFATETPAGSVQYYDGTTDTLYSPYASDDDGGYLRWRTYEYHTHLGVPIVFEPDIEIKAQNEMVIYPNETQPSLENDTIFDLAMVGKNTVDRTYVLKNKGTVDLTLTGGKITISGPQASDFYVVGTPTTIIPPRGKTTFTIRFQPAGVGERNATVTITSTDPEDTTYSFAIRGNGLSSQFKPTDISNCKLWCDASKITGVSDGARVDTWQDLSGNYNNLKKEAQSSYLGAVFKSNGKNGLPVLRFNADAAYEMSAPITDIRTVFWMVKEDSGYTGGSFLLGDTFNHFDYSRNGSGIANPPIWDSIYTSDKIKLGQTRLNGTLIDGTVTNMPTDYSVISVITTDNTRASRVQRDRGNEKLWKGEWGELIIYNKPLNWNEMRSVEIYLENKWLKTFNQVPEIAVHGNGSDIVNGNMQPSAGNGTDFGSVSTSGSIAQTFSIYNLGTGPLTISSPTITGTNAADFSITSQPLSTIDAGLSTTFVVTFQPSSAGEKNAVITIPNSDSDEGNFTFAIKGSGVAANQGQGPAGTVNCIAWFDASDIDGDGSDEGLAENGLNSDGTINLWVDKSQSGNNATPNATDSTPLLDVNSQNGLSTLKGDGVAYMKINELTNIRTVFWVLKEKDISSPHFLLGHDTDYAFHRGINPDATPDGSLWDEQYSAPEVSGGTTYLDQVLVDGTTTSLPLGDYHILSLVTTGSVKANQITRDRIYSGRSWKGSIAEIIIYNQPLSDSDRTAVENYLKSKWLTQQVRYNLTVNDGSGSGQYAAGTQVNIIAASAPSGKVFDQWSGDTSGVADVYAVNTTFTMPAKDASLSATYKISSADTYNISGTISGDIVSGVMVSADASHSAITDAGGNYTINGVVNGTYTVIASYSGYTFSPTYQDATVAGADITGINFNSVKNSSGAVSTPTDIPGCVAWYDGADPAGDGSTISISEKLDVWVDKSGNNNNASQADENMQAIINPSVLNSHSVVSFDGIDDFYSFTRIEDVRTVFWVFKETDYQNPHFLLGDAQSYDFSRGMDVNDKANGAFWHSIYTSGSIRAGSTFLNRNLVVDPMTEQLPTGRFNVVDLVTAGNVAASQITKDRGLPARSWNGDIAEIIIYNQPLSDSDRQKVENYLYDKWFATVQTTYSLSGTISGAAVAGVRVSVDANHSVVSDSSGKYNITNLDDGTYTVTPTLAGYKFTPATRQVTVAGGDVSGIDFYNTPISGSGVSSPLDINGCVMWLDGADPKDDGNPVDGKLTAWQNKADPEKTPYQPDPNIQAEVVTDALNGHSIIDFNGGVQTYDIIDPDLKKQNISALTYFWVIKENNIDNAHFFLGYLDDNDNTKSPFHRGITNDGAYAPDGKYWDDTYASGEVKNGQTFLDGVQVYPTEDVFPIGDYHIVSLITTGPVSFNQITQDRYAMGSRSWDGGIAEIIAYNSALSDSDRQSVEAYLSNKWFPNTSATFSVSGTVTENGAGLIGVTVSVDATHTAVTDSNGNYFIPDVHEGQYNVSPMLGGYTFSPVNIPVNVLGADVSGVNFVGTPLPPLTYTLTVNDGSGGGDYTENKSVKIFASIPNGKIFDQWTGDVQFLADVNSSTTTVTMPAQNITVTATFTTPPANTYTISGKITGDTVANVLIGLDSGTSNLTKSDGTYSISGLANGSYIVTPYLQDHTFTPQNKSVVIQDSNQSGIDFVSSRINPETYTVTVNNGTGSGVYEYNETVHIKATIPADMIFYQWTGDTQVLSDVTASETSFSMQKQNIIINATFVVPHTSTYKLSGAVTGVGIDNVIMTLNNGKTTVTDVNGNYLFNDLADGTYTVTPSKNGYTFSPTLQNVTINGADKVAQPFISTADSNPAFTLVVNYGLGGGVYAPNTVVNIAATVPGGFDFDKWTGDTRYIADANAQSTTFTMPAKDAAVTATFVPSPTPGNYSISGIVSGDVFAGVTITLNTGEAAVTDALGHYTIRNISNGTYTLTPKMSGFIFTPETAIVVVNGGNSTAPVITSKNASLTPPVAVDDSYNIQQDSTLSVLPQKGVCVNDVNFSESDLSVSVTTQPIHGTLRIQLDGGFTYTPSAGFFGSDTFTYIISDGSVTSNTAIVTINVIQAGNPVPATAIGDKYNVVMNGVLEKTSNDGVLSNDSPAGISAGVMLTASPLHGILRFLNSDGAFSYTPAKDYVGVDTFKYKIGNNGNIAVVSLVVAPIEVTLGSVVSVKASEVARMKGEKFVKTPKLYGVISGKKASLKKMKSASNLNETLGAWGKKISLYDKKTLKNTGYKAYFKKYGALSSQTIKLMIKTKTLKKNKIDDKVKELQLVPPVITGVFINNTTPVPVQGVAKGSTVIIKGRFFGEKAPKVALEVGGKLLKCKVDKKSMSYKNYKGKASCMDPKTGKSSIKVTLPSKKLGSGTFPIVLDNKIGIATTPYINNTDKGHLYEIRIR